MFSCSNTDNSFGTFKFAILNATSQYTDLTSLTKIFVTEKTLTLVNNRIHHLSLYIHNHMTSLFSGKQNNKCHGHERWAGKMSLIRVFLIASWSSVEGEYNDHTLAS